MNCPNCQSEDIIQRASNTFLIATLLTTAGFVYLLGIAFASLRGGGDGGSFTGSFYLLAGTLGLLWNLWLIRRWFVQRQRPYFCRHCGHEWA